MPVPELLIVENYETLPEIGHFAQISFEVSGISCIWSVQSYIKNQNQVQRDGRTQWSGGRGDLLRFLDSWVVTTEDWYDQYIVMNREAALMLVPFMCQPRVPFISKTIDKEIRDRCENFALSPFRSAI